MATEDQVQIGDLCTVEVVPEIVALQMLNPLEAHTNNLMDVEQSVGMLAEAAATPDMYPGAGQMYEVAKHRQGIFWDENFEDVGGFSILKAQASLYKRIWLRYGHIASSRVLKDIYASQVAVVSDIMTSIVDMDHCHPRELSSEFIDSWEKNIEIAEKLEFNIGWLRERLEDIKKTFAGKKKLQDTETESVQAKAHVDEAEQQLALAKTGLNMAKERLSSLDAKISPLRVEIQNFEEKCCGSLLFFDCGTSLSLFMPVEEPIDNNSNTGPSTIDKDAMPAEGPIDKDYSKTAPCTVDKDATLAEDTIDNSKAVPLTVEVEEEAIGNNSAASIPRRRRRRSLSSGNGVGDQKKPKTSTDGCAAATSLSITDYCPMPSRSMSPEITYSAPTAKQVFTEDEIMVVLLKHPGITSQELADVFRPRLITREDRLAFFEVMKGICRIHSKEDGTRCVVLIKKQNSGN